jgi:pyridoxal phosphate enzyme (YggS family)
MQPRPKPTLQDNLASVRNSISEAALRSGRTAGEIKLIAVSKTHPADAVSEAIAAGQTVFGENKVQEAEGKIATLGREGLEWHLIGHLQNNKARRAVRSFDVFHALDSLELAERLERICIEEDRETFEVMIEVDLAGEETKDGISEADLPALLEFLKTSTRLKLTGLMVVPPLSENAEDTRPFFKRLREMRDELIKQDAFTGAGELSMGMTHDFEIAIEEGATMVRIGTAIFGEREYNKSI